MIESEGGQIGRFQFQAMAAGLTEILRRYRMQVPENLMLMLKVIIMVLDVGAKPIPRSISTNVPGRLSAISGAVNLSLTNSAIRPATPSSRRQTVFLTCRGTSTKCSGRSRPGRSN